MRTPALHTPRSVLALILLVGFNVTVHADSTPESPPPQLTQAGVDLDFPGGALGDLADLLIKDTAAAVRLNLIVDPQYRKLTMPAIHVRNANPHALSQALDRMLRPQGVSVQTLFPNVPRSEGSGDPLFILVPVTDEETEESPLAFRSYAIAELLNRYTPEQIASALRTGWELDPANHPAALRIKYHPETQLLFVAGPSGSTIIRQGGRVRRPGSAIELAEEVISNLARQKNLPKAAAPEAPAAVAPQ